MRAHATFRWTALLLCAVGVVLAVAGFQTGETDPEGLGLPSTSASTTDAAIDQNAARLIEEGRRTFRYDTFGDEDFWGGTLRLHEAIAGERLGGIGAGVGPRTALLVGLKVDASAVSSTLMERIRRNPDDPAVTVELLRSNAVVGVTGFFDRRRLRSIGIQCALCHSTVDNSRAPGIGRRLDGWANRDLNIGAIAALAPNLRPLAELLGVDETTVRRVLNSWGPGKFDAELVLDGKAFRPDGRSAATLIPPAFGLAGVNLHTWTGWGSVTHWNAFVANLEMNGKGTFYDPRLNDAARFPIAARAGFGNVRNTPDLITSKLAALHFYQLSIPAPAPPRGSYEARAAERGKALFNGGARCGTCHVPPLFTEPGWNMHTPAEIGIDDFQAERSPDQRYRTAPLKGLWTHQKGGFYHDGRFATLMDVVNHYDQHFGLGLDRGAKRDLVEYLKSLGEAPAPDRDESDDDAAVLGLEPGGAEPLTLVQPNPSDGIAEIVFELPRTSTVDLAVYDIQGRLVASVARNRRLEAGEHRLVWDGRTDGGSMSPGLYFVRLRTEAGEWSRPLIRIP